MSTTPELTKGVPRHEGNSTFTPRADHNALADWVRDNVAPSFADIASLPASGNWTGRIAYVTSEDALWVFESGWKRLTPLGWQEPVLEPGISVAGGFLPPKFRINANSVELSVPGLDGSSGSGFALFRLPAFYRPALTVRFPATNGGFVQVTNDGLVSSTLTGTKSAVAFSGMFWL